VSRWHELPHEADATPARRSTAIVRLLIPFLIAGVVAVVGARTLAAVVAATATVLALVTWIRPAVGHRIAEALATAGRAVGHAVSWALLGLVELLVIVPLSFLARLFGRDPLRTAPGDGSRWSDRDERVSSRHTFGPDAHRRRPMGRIGRAVAVVPRVLGAVVLLLVANYAAGWLYDEYLGSHDQPAVTGAVSSADLAATSAMADEPWAEAYWAEFDALDHEFEPFLLTRVGDADGAYINARDGVRDSYQSTADSPVEVWFFGGGALWGAGQRDEHTIASEVARLAEAEGRPVRVVNLGQPGYTTWQSALLFEQQLAVRPAPDLAVFYDGADDVAVQLEEVTMTPSHYNLDGARVALTGRDSAADEARDLWEDYRETSVLTRLADGIRSVFGADVAYAGDGDDLTDTVIDLRARSRALLESVAEDHDVATLTVWQAATGVSGDDGAYRRAAAAGGADADLSVLLDDLADEVYLDGVLTDEEGARLVAGALWPLIAALLPAPGP